MFGVYLMYFVRKLKNPFIAETFVFVILAIILFTFISVPSILSNMLDSGNFYRYFVMAFSNTEIFVQLTLILTGIATLLFVRNITVHAILKTRFA